MLNYLHSRSHDMTALLFNFFRCFTLYLTPLKKFTVNNFTKYLSRVFLEHLNQNFHWGFKNWLKMQSVTFSNFKLKTHLHLISVHFMHWLTLFYFLTNDKNSKYIFPHVFPEWSFFTLAKVVIQKIATVYIYTVTSFCYLNSLWQFVSFW